MADEVLIQTPKVHVKLIRNTRGYNWEISVRDDFHPIVLAKIEEIDKELRQKYGSEDNG